MNKTITKKLLPLFLASFLVTIGLGNWMPIQAEEPEFSFSPIDLPFDSSTDGSAFVPGDRFIKPILLATNTELTI